MSRRLWFLFFALLGLVAQPASAQISAIVVASCGTPPSTYTAGQNRYVLIDTNGKLCDSGGGGGGGGAVTTNPTAVTPTDRGVTLTTLGTAQTVMAANPSRKAAYCSLPIDATAGTIVRLSTTGTAVNAQGTPNDFSMGPGGLFNLSSGATGAVIQSALSAVSNKNSTVLECKESQ